MNPETKKLLTGLVAVFLPLLSINASGVRAVVDISQNQLAVKKGLRVLKRFKIETSRYGIGSTIHSRKTPTGNFTLKKESGHRFGRVYRLSGYQGYRRGILIHIDLSKGSSGSNGCIHIMTPAEMNLLWSLLPDGASLRIRR